MSAKPRHRPIGSGRGAFLPTIVPRLDAADLGAYDFSGGSTTVDSGGYNEGRLRVAASSIGTCNPVEAGRQPASPIFLGRAP
jgi:hypothetical protein